MKLMLLLLAESVCSRMRELASRCTVVDRLRQRYGHMSIRRALMDSDPLLGHINVKDGHTVHPVGYWGG